MKVLIIYYKQKVITSTIRLGGLIKYLPEFGYEPIVLTNKPAPELNKYKVIVVPYDDDDFIEKLPFFLRNINKNSNIFSKIIRFLWDAFFLYPDIQKYWYEPASQSINNLLKNQDIDAIISSFPPVTPLLIASNLNKEYNVPWIADMRDLWTQYAYYNYKNFLPRYLIEKRLEKKILSQADCITIVSEPFAEKLKKIHKKVKNIYIIPNGFDPDIKNQNYNLTKKFTITYAGGLWAGKRDPEILFKAIKQLSIDNEVDLQDIQINFYMGYPQFDYFLNELVEKYSFENIVKIHGLAPREEVIKIEQKSQLLLLLRWDNPDEYGVVPGKIYEYLAAKRPILSIGSSGGIVEDLLNSTGAGVNLVSLEEIKKEILKNYKEYKSLGEVKYRGIPEEIEKYSHVEMTKKFVDILNRVLRNKN